MNKTKWFYLVVAVVFAVGLLVNASAKPPEEENPQEKEEAWVPPIPGMKKGEENLYFDWKYSNPMPRSIVPGYNIDSKEWLFQELEKRTQGRLKVTIYYGGALSSHAQNIPMCGTGLFELAMGGEMYHPVRIPFGQLGTMPFWISTADMTHEQCTDVWNYFCLHPLFQDQLATLNTICVAGEGGLGGGVIIIRKGVRDITKAADFSGLKCRTYGTWPTWAKALGMAGVQATVFEVYEVAQKGMIDVGITPYLFIRRSKLWEVCDRVIPEWIYSSGNAMVANLDAWNSLPQYIKDIWQELLPAYYDYYIKYTKTEEDLNWKLAAENGMKVYSLSEEEWANLQAAGKKQWDDWVAHTLKLAAGARLKEFLKDCIAYRNELAGAPFALYKP